LSPFQRLVRRAGACDSALADAHRRRHRFDGAGGISILRRLRTLYLLLGLPHGTGGRYSRS